MNNPVLTPAITLHNGQPVTTSLDVATKFNKNHRDVLRAIRELECSEEFSLRNFAQSTYLNDRKQSQPMYLITRDGFAFMAMGFTGAVAGRWKEAYITAFNAMEEKLVGERKALTDERNVEAMAARIALLEATLYSRLPVLVLEWQGKPVRGFWWAGQPLVSSRDVAAIYQEAYPDAGRREHHTPVSVMAQEAGLIPRWHRLAFGVQGVAKAAQASADSVRRGLGLGEKTTTFGVLTPAGMAALAPRLPELAEWYWRTFLPAMNERPRLPAGLAPAGLIAPSAEESLAA